MESCLQCVFCKNSFDSQMMLDRHKFNCHMMIKEEPPDSDDCSKRGSQTSNVNVKESAAIGGSKNTMNTQSIKQEETLVNTCFGKSRDNKCELKNQVTPSTSQHGQQPVDLNLLLKKPIIPNYRIRSSNRGRGRPRGKRGTLSTTPQRSYTPQYQSYQYIQPQSSSKVIPKSQPRNLNSGNSTLLQRSQTPLIQPFNPNIFGTTQCFPPSVPVTGMVGSQFNFGGSQPILQSVPTAASAINLFPQIQNLNMNLQLPVTNFPQNSLSVIPMTTNTTINGLTCTMSNSQPGPQGTAGVFSTHSKLTASSTASSVSGPPVLPILLGNQIILVGGDQLSFNSPQPKSAFSSNFAPLILPKPVVSTKLDNTKGANTAITSTCASSPMPVITSVMSLSEQSSSPTNKSSSPPSDLQSSKKSTVKDMLQSKKLMMKQEQDSLADSETDQKIQAQTQAIDLTVAKHSHSDDETQIISCDSSPSPTLQDEALDLSKKEQTPLMSSSATIECTDISKNKPALLQGIQNINRSDPNLIIKSKLPDSQDTNKGNLSILTDNLKYSQSFLISPQTNSAQLPPTIILPPSANNVIGQNLPSLSGNTDNTVVNLQFSNTVLPKFINNPPSNVLLNNPQAGQNVFIQNLVNNPANMIDRRFFPNSLILGPTPVIQPSLVPSTIAPRVPSISQPVSAKPFPQDSLPVIIPPSTMPALLSPGSLTAAQIANIPKLIPKGCFPVPIQSGNTSGLELAKMILPSGNVCPASSKTVKISSHGSCSSISSANTENALYKFLSTNNMNKILGSLPNKESTSLVTYTQAPISSTSAQSSSSSSLAGQHQRLINQLENFGPTKAKNNSTNPSSDSEIRIINVKSGDCSLELEKDKLSKTLTSDSQTITSKDNKKFVPLVNNNQAIRVETTRENKNFIPLINPHVIRESVPTDSAPGAKNMLVGPFTQEQLSYIQTDPSLIKNYVSMSGSYSLVNNKPITVQSDSLLVPIPKVPTQNKEKQSSSLSILPKPSPVVLMGPFNLGSSGLVPCSKAGSVLSSVPNTSLTSCQINNTKNFPFTDFSPKQSHLKKILSSTDLVSHSPDSNQSPIYIPDSPPPDNDSNVISEPKDSDQSSVKLSVSFKALESDHPVDIVLSLKDGPEAESIVDSSSFQYILDKVPQESSYWSSENKGRKKKFLSAKRRQSLERERFMKQIKKRKDTSLTEENSSSKSNKWYQKISHNNMPYLKMLKVKPEQENLPNTESDQELGPHGHSRLNFVGDIDLLTSALRKSVVLVKQLAIDEKEVKDALIYYINKTGSISRPSISLCNKRKRIKNLSTCIESADDENPMPPLENESNSTTKPGHTQDIGKVKCKRRTSSSGTSINDRNIAYAIKSFKECHPIEPGDDDNPMPLLTKESESNNSIKPYKVQDFVHYYPPDLHNEIYRSKDENTSSNITEVKAQNDFQNNHGTRRSHRISKKPKLDYSVLERQPFNGLQDEIGESDSDFETDKNEKFEIVLEKDEVYEEEMVEQKDGEHIEDEHIDDEAKDENYVYDIVEEEEDEEYDEIIVYNTPPSGGQKYHYHDNLSLADSQPIREGTTTDSHAPEIYSSVLLQPSGSKCLDTSGKEDDSQIDEDDPPLQVDLSADPSTVSSQNENKPSMYYSSESDSDIFEEVVPVVEADKNKIMRKRQQEVMKFLLKQSGNFISEEEGDSDLYLCDICKSYKTNGIFSISKHLKKHLNGILKCEHCTVEFCNEKYLSDHQCSGQCGS